jgi:ATP-binding cassette, subfamily F, member 3
MLLAGDDEVKIAAKPVEKPKKASRDEIPPCAPRCANARTPGKLNEMRDKLAKKLADPALYEEAAWASGWKPGTANTPR